MFNAKEKLQVIVYVQTHGNHAACRERERLPLTATLEGLSDKIMWQSTCTQQGLRITCAGHDHGRGTFAWL